MCNDLMTSDVPVVDFVICGVYPGNGLGVLSKVSPRIVTDVNFL